MTDTIRPIRYAVIGLRNIGRNHCRRIDEASGAELVALVDADASRLAAAAEQFPGRRCFTDASEAFAEEGIDAVVLALPNHLHQALAVAALTAGKHVLCEKPMARSLEECDRMLAARDRSGRQLMIGMNQRYDPNVAAGRALIASGAIGEVRQVRTWWNRRSMAAGLWQRGAWGLSMAGSGGGPMMDLGVHKLDLALHLVGWPAAEVAAAAAWSGNGAVEAQRRGLHYEIEDAAVGHLQLAGGGMCSVEAAYLGGFEQEETQGVEVVGSAGGLRLAGGLRAWDADGADITPQPDAKAATSCAAHFTRVLRGEESLSSTPEQGLELLRLIGDIYQRAGFTGHPAPLAV